MGDFIKMIKFLNKQKYIIMVFVFLFMTSVGFSGVDKKEKEGDKLKYHSEEVLVKFNKNTSPMNIRQSINSLGAKKEKKFNLIRNHNNSHLKRWRIITIPKGISVEKFIEKISKNPNVEIAEPNYLVSILRTPNDQFFDLLWGMHNIQNDADIDAPEAWDKLTGSNNIVAVIDTGVDYTHEDLAANMWVNPGEVAGNGIDDDNNGYVDDIHGADFFGDNDTDPMDDHGHGTHVAGTIAAVGDNGVGVTGVSWNTKIMALKFLGPNGGGYVVDAVEAIEYAINNGANILNNSWSGGGYSQAMFDFISAANDAGILFVAAAGNNHTNNDVAEVYPQGYQLDNVISVAATNRYDNLANFSNYGANSVHLGAPGVAIYSTVPTNVCTACSNGYLSFNGTSMAAPHVSGAAALLLAQSPSMSAFDLKATLMSSVDPIPSLAGYTISGGRLNVNNALENVSANFDVSFSPRNQTVLHGNSVTYTVTITATTADIALNLALQPLSIGLTGTLADDSLIIPMNTSASTTITINTSAHMARGYYPIQLAITDADNNVFHALANLQVLVPGYSISSTPANLTVGPNGTVTYGLILSSIDGYSGSVRLHTTTPEPSLSATLLPSSEVILAADDRVASTLSVTTDITTPIQTHNITIFADNDTASESSTVQLTLLDIDLQPTEITPATTTWHSGTSTSLSSTITNIGMNSSGTTTYASIYLSPDATITSSDELLATRFIHSLDAGLSNTRTSNIIVPSHLTAGTYYLGVIADSSHLIDETNEANNTLLAVDTIQVVVDVDLQPTELTATTITWHSGANISVSSTITNNGTSSSGTTTYAGIYLSSDAAITSSDQLLATQLVRNLDAGLSTTSTSNIVVPSNLTAGTYYLGVIADRSNVINETNETNNSLQAADAIQVVVNIDLQPTEITPASNTWHSGASTSVSSTITNHGTSSSGTTTYAGIYLSADAMITSSDQLLATHLVRDLGPGLSNAHMSNIVVPSNLTAGTYYLGAIADRSNAISETNEANNALLATDVIDVVVDIDLQPTAITPASITWHRGTSLTMSSTITNHGMSSSGATTYAGIYLSSDATITSGDQLLATHLVRDLSSGLSNTRTSSITVPSYLTAGTYYLGVVADRSNVINETNEENNTLLYTTTITLQ